MNLKLPLQALAFSLTLSAAWLAQASTPASQMATAPTAPAAPVVLSWTGTALPGSSGAASACQQGADDSHDIVLTVPAGLYDTQSVTADFEIKFTQGTSNGVTSDPDLVLSIFDGNGNDLGDSDTSGNEAVRVVNPPAGTLSAVVCPFAATAPTDYTATLTLTAVAPAACVMAPTTVTANAVSTKAPSPLRSLDNEAAGLPNFDLFRQLTWNKLVALPTALGFAGRLQSGIYDRTLGVPTFLWASSAARPVSVGPLASEKAILAARARAHLRDEAKMLKLSAAMINEAEVANAQYNGDGPAVVRLRQRVNGFEVFHRYLNVLLNRKDVPIAVSGYFSTGYATPTTVFALTPQQAIAKAWAGVGGALNPVSLVLKSTVGEYQGYSLSTPLTGSHVFEREPRVRRMYYTGADGQLVPAYYVELFAVAKANRNLSAYALMISAADGTILHRDNLKASEVPPPGATSMPWNYRAYADATPPFRLFDQPLGNGYTPFPGTDPAAKIARVPDPALPNLVSLAYGPIVTKDAWLADDATESVGNNVDACLDKFDPANSTLSTPYNTCTDPLSQAQGDFRAVPSSDHSFDYTAAPDADPTTPQAQSGAVVSLFYLNNWLHDWWYNHGFDEASGNAQTDNYGRGGVEADPIKAQGQDGSGRNNANMATPADGSSPTMQQYLFNGEIKGIVDVQATLNLGSIAFNGVEYGPQTFDYTGMAALGNDQFAPTNDGCTGLSTPAGPEVPVLGSPTVPVPVPNPDPNLFGKIAVIPRGGGCPGSYKVKWAVESGATGVVLVHNADGPPPYLVNGDIPVESPAQPTNTVYQIPIVTVRMDDGKKIMDALAAGKAVSMRLKREPTIDFDGTLDNQVVGHEFFHYVHHRLTDSSNQQADAMSEGWGDTDAMMISVRPDDVLAPDNAHWQGAYDLAGYAINNFYSGIRRAPYSTDFAKNPFTLKDLPGDPEVHSAGEIWANQMWSCYAGILNTTGNGTFLQKQLRMQAYIITGLKMTPPDATYTEARDAILAAVYGMNSVDNNFVDFKACSDGFAVRGSGLKAISPARDSTDLTGVMEDFTPFVCAASGSSGGSSSSSGGSTSSSSSGGSTSSSSSGGSTSSSGGVIVLPGTSNPGRNEGRFGGGALGLFFLLPMLLLARLRKPR